MSHNGGWRWSRCCGWAIALASGLAGRALPVLAQTGFAWDSVADVGRYTTFEECTAAIRRLSGMEWRRQRLTIGWADTMEASQRLQPDRLSPAAVAFVRRCMTRFTPNDTTLDAFPLNDVIEGFRTADRIPDAETVVARRVTAAKNDTAAVTAIVDTALSLRLSTQPLRGLRERLLAAQAKREGWSQRRQLEALHYWAQTVGDTTQAKALFRQLTAGNWLDTLKMLLKTPMASQIPYPTLLSDSGTRKYAMQLMLSQILDVYGDSLLDTLKLGTERWKAAQRTLLTKVAGPELAPLAFVDKITGKPAPPVSGDFWFNYDSTAGPRPTRGKVGLVVFVNGVGVLKGRNTVDGQSVSGRCLGLPDLQTPRRRESLITDRCWALLVPLRRLMKRFPALEVTLVSSTSGDGLYRALADSAEAEAELIRQLLLDGHQLKGAALAVTETTFFRLSDGRMMLRPTSNRTVVEYEKQLGETNEGTMYLVDRQGLVVDRVSFDDPGLEKLVDAVLRQPERP